MSCSATTQCPALKNCKYGRYYPTSGLCAHSHRNDDGLWVCSNFQPIATVKLDDMAPVIDLFEDSDFEGTD